MFLNRTWVFVISLIPRSYNHITHNENVDNNKKILQEPNVFLIIKLIYQVLFLLFNV